MKAILTCETNAPADDLINAMNDHGVLITPDDIATILSIGVDTFLKRRNVEVSDDDLLEMYLMLDELKTRRA